MVCGLLKKLLSRTLKILGELGERGDEVGGKEGDGERLIAELMPWEPTPEADGRTVLICFLTPSFC